MNIQTASVHEKENTFNCGTCDSEFAVSFKIHTNVVRDGKRPFQCTKCGLRFGYISEGRKPFNCDNPIEKS